MLTVAGMWEQSVMVEVTVESTCEIWDVVSAHKAGS